MKELQRQCPGMARFGAHEFNPNTGELRKHGVRIKLPDQSAEILTALLERPGQLVSREELRQKLWPNDTFVDFDHGLNNATNRLREALGDSADAPRFIETLPRRGYRFIAPLERAGQERTPLHIESLAVLPLENLTGDVAQEYFVDGMTDTLTTRLAQIGALRVISRTSAMHYKGTHKKLPEIAGELNVDAVVEGTVLRSGSHVCINVQLIQARTDQHLWAKQYERELTDILLLQAEVASAVAREIQVTLTPQEEARLTLTRRVNLEAYQAFLRGRFFWNKRTEDGLKKGLQYFQQSVEKDPTYAFTYVGLADSYSMLGFWGLAAPHEASPRAKAAANKALEIDEELGEGHAARGWVQFVYEWNWTDAEKELRRAIELNPGYATAHQWYSHLLTYQGRYPEASREVQRTLELDPLSWVMSSNSAFVCLLARQFDEAVERARSTVELDSVVPTPHLWLGCAYEGKGQFNEALIEFHQAVDLSGGTACYVSAVGHCYAVAGQTDEARRILAQLAEMAKHHYVSAYDFAVVHAGLGDKEAVCTWLHKAFDEHSAWLAFLKGDYRLDPVRSDPQFADLVRRIGLPVD